MAQDQVAETGMAVATQVQAALASPDVTPVALSGCFDILLPDPIVTEVIATRFLRPAMSAAPTEDAPDQPEDVYPAMRAGPSKSVLPRTLVDPMDAVRRVAGHANATWLDAQGGVSLVPEWNRAD